MASRFSIESTINMKDRTAGAFRSAKGNAGAFVGGMKSILAPLAGFLAVGQIINFGKSAVTAFKESQGAIANIEAGLQSTNNAIGMNSKQLQTMAAGWQKISIFEDDAILQNVTAQLLTFGNIGKANFDRVQGAVQNVTAKLKGINATGEDLKGTSIMLGKAMEDPIRGMSALRRVGISFNEAEQKNIATMQKAGDLLGAQNFMLQAIERQYGGTAKALAGTDAGKIITRQNEIGDSMENIGKAIIPLQAIFLSVAAVMVSKIASVADTFSAWYVINKSIIDQGLDTFIGAISTAFDILWPVVKTSFDIFVALAGIIIDTIQFLIPMAPAIIAGAAAWGIMTLALNAHKITLLATTIATTATTAAQWLLNAAMSANPVGLVVIGIAALIAILVFAAMHIKQIIAFFKEWGGVIMLALGPLGLMINAITAIVSRWNEVKAAFASGGIIGALQQIGVIILQSLIAPVQKLLMLIAKIPGMGGIAMGISDALGGMAGMTTQSRATGSGMPAQYTQYGAQKGQYMQANAGKTVVQNGNVNVNVAAPQSQPATVTRTGQQPQGLTVNMGAAQ